MRFPLRCAAIGVLLACTHAASATVNVAIDLTHQRMHVDADEGTFDWPISSARSGFSTPGGSYAPTHLELMHYSKKYHMSPMPHAIFFRGGYAIHGTDATGSLGRPASHGCVRLAPRNAATLYAMVRREGARISISGSPPASRPFVEARHRSHARTYAAEDIYGDSDDGVRRYRPRRERAEYGYGYARRPQYYYAQPNYRAYGQAPFLNGF